ncbi:MAG: hypothetical protein FWH26_04625 [Oscillospiraceae bacterium]|nr:hypothetical protein [Oscillospiraceae bacterium]
MFLNQRANSRRTTILQHASAYVNGFSPNFEQLFFKTGRKPDIWESKLRGPSIPGRVAAGGARPAARKEKISEYFSNAETYQKQLVLYCLLPLNSNENNHKFDGKKH